MQASQAINYLQSVAGIQPSEMSRGMFRLCRSAARSVMSLYPVDANGEVAGYYDPEDADTVRARPYDFRFPPAYPRDVNPQSERLMAALSAKFPIHDPCFDFKLLFGEVCP